jgi:hypothetical protein
MLKKGKTLTFTHAELSGYEKKRVAVVKNISAQLDTAVKSNKSAAQLKLTMKSVKTKLGQLPPHFGRGCNIQPSK